jgi:uncharacterized membrane protein YqaE (UPF0057 family)
MKMRLILSAAVLGTLILGSCGTSNDVVGGGILQKRKYNKGFYWNRNANAKDSETVKIEEVKGSDVEYAMEQESASSAVTVRDAYASVETSQDVASVNESEVTVTMNDAAVVSAKNSAASEVANSETSTGKFSVFKAKKEAVKLVKKNSSSPASDVATILLVILAILIPPLAVFLFEGASGRFWIDLILAIIGWGVGFWLLGGLGWICGIAAIIYALLIVLSVI